MQNYSPLNLSSHTRKNIPVPEPQRVDYGQVQATAQEYKELCLNAGHVSKGANVGGWTVIKTEINTQNNFRATAYSKNGKIVICYEGTDAKSIKDHGANLKMGLGMDSAQMKSALGFYDEIKNDYSGAQIDVAGHSEGGSEAMYVALSTGANAYTYNPYGLSDGLIKDAKGNNKTAREAKILNFRDPNDPISKMRKLIGYTFIVPSTAGNWIMSKTPLGWLRAHRLDNMGDIRKSVPVDIYKLLDDTFLDTVNEMHITDQNIIDMPTDIFSLFESEIDERLRNYQITDEQTAQQMALRGELVYVRGYQRRDGTIVKGYYRRAA